MAFNLTETLAQYPFQEIQVWTNCKQASPKHVQPVLMYASDSLALEIYEVFVQHLLCSISRDVLVTMTQCFVREWTLSSASGRNCRLCEFAQKGSAVTHELYIVWTWAFDLTLEPSYWHKAFWEHYHRPPKCTGDLSAVIAGLRCLEMKIFMAFKRVM